MAGKPGRADILRKLGVNDDFITIVNNSVDTTAMKTASVMDAASKERKKSELGLGHSPAAVCCARLAKNKALPFVVEACRAAREKFGEFTLFFIGDGHYGLWLHEQAKKESWIRPLGPLYGAEKAEVLALSDVFLLPSMVGLSILDSFAAMTRLFQKHRQGPTGDIRRARVQVRHRCRIPVLCQMLNGRVGPAN